MGASAAKLLIYYHPDSGDLAAEIEGLIARVAAECHALDLPLFVEPLSYSLDANVAKNSAEFAAQRPQIVIETARRLSGLGADVLKLEFPVDAAFEADEARWRATCEAVSAASTVPWVLLSAGVDFDTFERQVRIACQAGASGFLGGRAIWKESIPLSTTEREAFLRSVSVERLRTLTALATEHARPWTDFYAAPALAEGWFQAYLPGEAS